MSFLPMMSAEPAQALIESQWGDVVPWQDYPQQDWPDGSFPGSTLSSPYSTIEDRADGRCRPLYDNETDLARQRSCARKLAVITPIREAALEQLKRHIFGEGVTYKVAPAPGRNVGPDLVAKVQRFVDDFVDRTHLTNVVDCELHDRSREDGEAIVQLEWNNKRVELCIHEPDAMKEPTASGDLWSWLEATHGIDVSGFVPSWSFGVLTPARDASKPLAYFFAHDSGGRDWDVAPASDVVHIRRNVPSKAKRGVSDFLTLFGDLPTEAKLARNMITGAALQAAIAWIEELTSGTTKAQAESIGFGDATRQMPTNIGNGGGSRSVRSQHYGPGSIIRPSAGRQYKAGPMGAERNGNFQLAAQYILRRAGIRWSMPEYMISGDASNGNYSSLLVAESPFVKAREADQRFYGAALRELVWKAIGLAWRRGALDSWQVSLCELRQLVDLNVNFPSVATRDREKLVNSLAIEKQQGWVSDATAMTELGRDPAAERGQGAQAQSNPPAGTDQLGALVRQAMGGRLRERMALINAAQRLSERTWEAYP